MNIEIINKLDEITNILKSDKDLKKMKELEKEILNDKALLNKIKDLKEIEQYNDKYLELKKEILYDDKYKEYKYLEHDLLLVIYEINKKLNRLIEKSGCN